MNCGFVIAWERNFLLLLFSTSKFAVQLKCITKQLLNSVYQTEVSFVLRSSNTKIVRRSSAVVTNAHRRPPLPPYFFRLGQGLFSSKRKYPGYEVAYNSCSSYFALSHMRKDFYSIVACMQTHFRAECRHAG